MKNINMINLIPEELENKMVYFREDLINLNFLISNSTNDFNYKLNENLLCQEHMLFLNEENILSSSTDFIVGTFKSIISNICNYIINLIKKIWNLIKNFISSFEREIVKKYLTNETFYKLKSRCKDVKNFTNFKIKGIKKIDDVEKFRFIVEYYWKKVLSSLIISNNNEAKWFSLKASESFCVKIDLNEDKDISNQEFKERLLFDVFLKPTKYTEMKYKSDTNNYQKSELTTILNEILKYSNDPNHLEISELFFEKNKEALDKVFNICLDYIKYFCDNYNKIYSNYKDMYEKLSKNINKWPTISENDVEYLIFPSPCSHIITPFLIEKNNTEEFKNKAYYQNKVAIFFEFTQLYSNCLLETCAKAILTIFQIYKGIYDNRIDD